VKPKCFFCFFLIDCSILLAGVEVAEIVAVAAGVLASGEAVGACANTLVASAREQT
jgi:hypothetical protein